MERGEPGAFEVFVQIGGAGNPIQHVGSVRGSDPELAWHAAKEIYGRREDCSLLWVFDRAGMVTSTADDLTVLGSGRRIEYRLPAFPSRRRRDRAARTEVVS